MDLLGIASTLVAVLVPVFVAMDPLGALPLVTAWTADILPAERDRQLRDALLTALALGLVFVLVGKPLLAALGVGVPDFLIAGGLVLLGLAISDIIAGGGHEGRGILPNRDFGVVPIGTPLLAGPATLTTLVILVDRFGLVLTLVSLLVNMVVAWRLFRQANNLTRLLGRNGLRATSKVVSLLLAAIAVRLVREGVLALLATTSP